jgi:P-type Ca2+ transporter type 2C
MSALAAPTTPGSDVTWYALTPEEAAERLQVDPASGLAPSEATQRLQTHGPNALAEAKAEPVWRRFLKQYREYMHIVASARRSSAC